MNSETRNVLVFRAELFGLDFPSERDDPSTLPAGRECALFIKENLIPRGFVVPEYDPVEGEECWQIDVEKDGSRYSLFVMWAPLGIPPLDYWVVQVSKRGNLFGNSSVLPDDASIESNLKNELEESVRSAESVSEIRWLTDEQFRSEY